MINVQNLVFEYPETRVLHDISFVLPNNSVTALVGPNGAGKTTLLRCMAALERPFSGSLEIAGADVVQEPRSVHANVGFLYDFYGLYEALTVTQSLQYRVAAQGVPADQQASLVDKAINQLGLTEKANQAAGNLSRGWRQKLSIALGIVHDPKVVLLDEPASGLDPEARAELSALFRTLQAEGKTLVVSSHILGELEDYSSHLLMIRDGRMAPVKALHQATNEGHSVDSSRVIMRVELANSQQTDPWFELNIDEVDIIQSTPNSALLAMPKADEERHRVLRELIQKDLTISAFERQRSNLKEAYKDSLGVLTATR